eukprot:11227970-Lingulodinium_polyedra.AAC.1
MAELAKSTWTQSATKTRDRKQNGVVSRLAQETKRQTRAEQDSMGGLPADLKQALARSIICTHGTSCLRAG